MPKLKAKPKPKLKQKPGSFVSGMSAGRRVIGSAGTSRTPAGTAGVSRKATGRTAARRTGAAAISAAATSPARSASRRTASGSPVAIKPAARRTTAAGRSTAVRRSRFSLVRSTAASRKTQALPDLQGTLSVIISARNEEHTLQHLLKQVTRLQPAEIIVVLNGCSDNSFQVSRLHKQAIVVHCPDSAGHDVARAIGAKLSKGDILLFLDGDMVIPAPLLAPFAAAVDRGVDVALNDLDALLPPFGLSDDVTRCKLFLNLVLGRPDLGVSSMTAVPHALSRRALETIGYRELMVPPKAQAVSIMEKLRVEKAGTVNVIKHNRLRQGNTGAGNAMEKLITGDHAEALLHALSRQEAAGLPYGGKLQEHHRRQIAVWRNAL